MRGKCRNCDERVLWGRWCIDCVRAAGKTLATELVIAGLVAFCRWMSR